MLNLSGSAVADQLHGIGSGVATAEQAGCCQPPVEVRDPGSLPANAFDLRIAGGRARDFRSIERYTARHVEARRDLRECARADKRAEKYCEPRWGFHVQSLLCSSAALLPRNYPGTAFILSQFNLKRDGKAATRRYKGIGVDNSLSATTHGSTAPSRTMANGHW